MKRTAEPERLRRPRASTIGAFVLVVAATCLFGALWGVAKGNWVLVATEVPAVAALVAVWVLHRAGATGSRVAQGAAAVGLLCAVELWIATALFDVQGLALAVVVAASTGVIGAGAVGYWIRRGDAVHSQRPLGGVL